MVRADFNRNLDDLQEELLQLAELVEWAIVKSMEALTTGSTELANQVILNDDIVDQKRFVLEERCTDLIATQQPLAIDLRTLVTVLQVAVELERVGDYAEGIGKICLIMDQGAPARIPDNIQRMADLGIGMLRGSLRAVANRDEELAVYRQIFENMAHDPRSIRDSTHLLWVAHDLERIADRATNIAERAVFLVTGKSF